ncbi:hypothetical protein Ndes2526B_g07618 [Nannochloris sp. 'desiccata']|nr:putative Inositol-tetrakisphosphate 1-kinase 5 [Chlorella desiccata (nom. nud.)]
MVLEKEGQHFVVGMALKAEKAKKHISQKLIDYAAGHGIHLKVIDENVTLEDQGHLDAICQKIRRREWEEELEAYAAAHPRVSIHDMPQDTYVLRNRGTMLVPLQTPGETFFPPPPPTNRNIENNGTPMLPIRCCAPEHTTIEANTPFSAAKAQLLKAGIRFPVIVKALLADGGPSSHALAVIHSDAGLLRITQGEFSSEGLALPLLFEQYINHGGCLFKVYVLGNHEVMVTRPSLDLSSNEREEESVVGIEQFRDNIDTIDVSTSLEGGSMQGVEVGTSPPIPKREELERFKIPPPDVEVVSRVSAYPRSRSWGKYDLAPRGHGVPAPPEWLWRGIASKLRTALCLSLFNFDLIVPVAPAPHQAGLVDPCSGTAEEGLVHIIDINYFPGIEKLPNYEALLVQFFLDLKSATSQSSKR